MVRRGCCRDRGGWEGVPKMSCPWWDPCAMCEAGVGHQEGRSARSPGHAALWGRVALHGKLLKRVQLGCRLEETQILKPRTFYETVLVSQPTLLLSSSMAGPAGPLG